MARRAKGEGSIFLNRASGRWTAYITVNGQRRYRTGKAKGDVAKKLAALKADSNSPQRTPTVAQFAQALLEGELKEQHKYGHWITNEIYWRTRLAPSTLGDMPLNTVRTMHIQHFIDVQKPLKGKGKLSPTTVRRIGALVSLVFSKAKSPRYGLIEHNPCDGVEYPQIRKTVKRTLTPA